MSHPHGEATPAPVWNRPGLPQVRYRVGDHPRFRRAMVEALPRAEVAGVRPLAGLTARDAGDPAIALLDAWAVACDVLTFYQERVANLAYLRTSDQAQRVAALVGHRPAPGRAASTLLSFTVEHEAPTEVPQGLRVQTAPDPGQKPALFETDVPLRAHRGLNRLGVRASRPEPPGAGATHVWLAGERTGLRAGDTVLLVGPTAASDPANGPWHLRILTRVEGAQGRTRIAWEVPLPAGTPPMAVHAVEREARGFGHNAPDWAALKRLFDAAQAHLPKPNDPPTNPPQPPQKDFAALVPAWGDISFFQPLPGAPAQRPLDLDAPYPVRPGSWAALVNSVAAPAGSGYPVGARLLRVDAATEVARKDYHLAATVTRLAVRPPSNSEESQALAALFPATSSKLLAFGPELPQAEATAGPLRAGSMALDLDGAYPDLAPGRLLLLEGREVRIHRGLEGTPVRFQDPTFAPTVRASGAVRLVRVALGPGAGQAAFVLKAPQNLGGQVQAHDVLLAGAAGGRVAGEAVRATDAALVGKGARVEGHVLFVDVDGDGRYGRGDAVYVSSRPDRLVATGTVASGAFSFRLTPSPPPAAGARRPAGTLVAAGDADLAAWGHAARGSLHVDGPPGVALFDADGDGEFRAGGDRLYLTPGPVGDGAGVPPDAVRLHGGPFGSQVAFGDQDHPLLPDSALPGGGPGERIEPLGPAVEELIVSRVLRGDGGRTRIELESGLRRDYDPAATVLHGNVAPASHGETQRLEPLGSGDASAQHQAFPLAKAPLTHVADPQGEHGVAPELVVRVGGVAWAQRPTLHGAGPGEQAFALERTPDGTFVRFGDGEAGSRLPTGTQNVTALYRQGLGRAGNARPGQVRNLKDKPKGLKGATNPVPATGGVDPEPTEATRSAAPEGVLVLDRVVSLRDFEDAARAYVGVAKARARLAWHAGSRVVELTVAGDGGTRLAEGDPLRRDLLRHLDARRDPHQPVRLRAHDPVPVLIAVRVEADPRHDAEAVRAAARAQLLARFAFDARDLGAPVRQGDLLEALHRVPGLVGAHVRGLARGAATGAAGEPPAFLPMQAHELATLDPAHLRVLLPGETA